jgi:hypothetical protein
MKNNKIKLLTLAVGLILGIGSAQAANMSYTLYADLPVNLPTASDPSAQEGRVWFGNFSSGNSLLTLAAVQSTGLNTLLDSFRPLTSFAISSGGLLNDTGNGVRGSISVGGASITAGNFAGQDAYILALNSTSSVWTTALSAWKADGSVSSNGAILIRSGNDFALNSGDPTSDFALDSGNGQLIFGTQTASSITASTVPEPSVGMLFLIGVAGLGALRLRRRAV